jgi:hypothetical protein
VYGRERVGAGEVGDRARDAENPVVAARREAETLDSSAEGSAGGVLARSAAARAGISTWRSMRSSSGRERRPR